MPDVWTANPAKLRRALETTGAECGGAPRVLKDRDPNWTCWIDRSAPDEHGIIGYDVYIHDVADVYRFTGVEVICFFTAMGILIGFLWGRRFRPT